MFLFFLTPSASVKSFDLPGFICKDQSPLRFLLQLSKARKNKSGTKEGELSHSVQKELCLTHLSKPEERWRLPAGLGV